MTLERKAIINTLLILTLIAGVFAVTFVVGIFGSSKTQDDPKFLVNVCMDPLPNRNPNFFAFDFRMSDEAQAQEVLLKKEDGKYCSNLPRDFRPRGSDLAISVMVTLKPREDIGRPVLHLTFKNPITSLTGHETLQPQDGTYRWQIYGLRASSTPTAILVGPTTSSELSSTNQP